MRAFRSFLIGFALAVGLAGCGGGGTSGSAPIQNAGAIPPAEQGRAAAGSRYALYVLMGAPFNSVNVFQSDARDRDAPIRVISGNNTQISVPSAMAMGQHGELYVLNNNAFPGAANPTVVVFAPGANGNVAPIRTISGFATAQHDVVEGLAVDPNGNVYVSIVDAKHTVVPQILVLPPGANGNTAPVRAIDVPIALSGRLAADAGGKLYVGGAAGDCGPSNKIVIFPANANGSAAPDGEIQGADTGLCGANVAVDANGKIYAANIVNGTVTVYEPTARGDAAPTHTGTIGLPPTNPPIHLAVDPSGNVYVATCCAPSSGNSVVVFDQGLVKTGLLHSVDEPIDVAVGAL